MTTTVCRNRHNLSNFASAPTLFILYFIFIKKQLYFVQSYSLTKGSYFFPYSFNKRKDPSTKLLSTNSQYSSEVSATSSAQNQPPALLLNDITCSHDGGQTYQLKQLSYILPRNAKVGLVGRNGCGKSTLLRIIQQECNSNQDSNNNGSLDFVYQGTIEKGKDITRVAYVEQEPPSPNDVTVSDALLGVSSLPSSSSFNPILSSNIFDTVRDYRISTLLSSSNSLEQLTNQMNEQNGWLILSKSEEVASRLRIHHLLSQPLSTLSGGERKRVALAAALVQEPHVLLLDEPTNHLDLLGLQYLQEYFDSPVVKNSMTLLMVTHDRAFLDQTCDAILELDQGKIYSYSTRVQETNDGLTGGYALYLQGKQDRMIQQQAIMASMKNKFKGELDWMRRQPQARESKSKARIDAFYKLQGNLNQQENIVGNDKKLVLESQNRRIGNQILQAKDVCLSFGERVILTDFSYDFKKGDRIGIVGPNGVGKSTFLKVLTGEQEINKGHIKTGETIVFGVYDQLGLVALTSDPEKMDLRVLDFIKEEVVANSDTTTSTVDATQQARNLLTKFDFPRKKWNDFIRTLSGGEKRRLQLLSILTKNPNFLILDEPTNDVDLDTLTSLEEYLLNDFNGVLLVVSHDRFFTDKVTDHLFVFNNENNGLVEDYLGTLTDYADYLYSVSSSNTESNSYAKKKMSYKEDKQVRVQKRNQIKKSKREMQNLENAIEKGKDKLKELQLGLEKSSNDGEGWTVLAEWNDKIQIIQDEIVEKEMRWLELAEFLEEEETTEDA